MNMNRQEEKALEYQNANLNAAPYDAFLDGYQYAKKRIAEILLCIELNNFFPTLDEDEEIAKGRKKLIEFISKIMEEL